jgi:hypothetical protein
MTGKRAKPSPWRFLRATPVVIVAVVVWVTVGLFLLFPDSGGDRAQDSGIDPIPSNSNPKVAGTPDPVAPGPSLSSPTGAQPSSPPTTAPDDGPAPKRPTAPDLELSGASTHATSTARRRPLPTSDPSVAAPTEPRPGPPDDNPGKKKGHLKRVGPPTERPLPH